MMLDVHITKKGSLRLAAVLAVAIIANACSSLPDVPDVPDWVDPTTWFGDDTTTVAEPDNGQTAAAQQNNGQATADQPTNGQTPDLASLPEKPTASSEADQQRVANSLAADRAHAKYSSEVLRGGTEAAAAPPPDVELAQVASGSETLPVAAESKPAQQGSAPKPGTAHVDQSVAQAPRGPVVPGSLPSPGPATRVASLPAPEQPLAAPPPGAQPAVPPTPAVPDIAPAGSINPSDAALGFKPSHAPQLDASVAQFVAPPILQRYQATAAGAGLHYTPVAVNPPQTGLHKHRGAMKGEGGPATMTGAVVANLDALQSAGTPSVYASPQGLPATAVVFFPGDSVSLNTGAREQVKAAAEQYKANGGQGSVRVVGHSSSRTPNMPLERHLEAVFTKSQERANAVARELIRDGVPASKVLVEAVGDSQPVFYELMPKGEDGNRRAEIFLQG